VDETPKLNENWRAKVDEDGHYSFAGIPLHTPIGKSAMACDLKLRVMLASQYRRVISVPL